MAEGVKTPIEPGMIARLVAGVRYGITGSKPDWFGPGEPIAPMAQEQTAGRQFDYPVAYNTRYTPRSGEAISFAQLRGLADSCDVLRLVIETRKDQVAKLKWSVKPRDEKSQSDDRCRAIEDFFAFPDKEHSWDDWLRMLLEDLFVIDAPAIYVRPTIGGDVYAFEPIDGSTIKRVLDENGRTPMAPQPAYQQILKGVPAVDYSSDELIYTPRNPRTHKIYGYSPVEQIIITINTALRRSLHQLQYYTEGNVPEALIGVPETWNPDQIKRFQEYWDMMLEGNTAERRHAKFIPGGLKIQETKPAALKDEYDEWLARVVCFAFSIASTPFTKQVNRATAETAQEAAVSEGLAPIMLWIQSLANKIIAKYFDAPDLGFFWIEETIQQPEIAAKIIDTKLKNATMTINEARAIDGLDPVEGGDELMIYTSAGAVLLKDVINPPPPPEPPPIVMAPPPGDGSEPPPVPPNKEALGKAKKTMAHIDRERAEIVRQQAKLKKVVAAFLTEKGKDVASQIIEAMDSTGKMSADDVSRLGRILEAINTNDWAALAGDVQNILEAVTRDGSITALAQIGIKDAGEELVNLLNDKALDYSKERSAELVGMKYVDGELVENPDAEWAISESTREMVRSDVARAIEEGMSNDDLADLLAENYAFSDERAEMIARTETAFADVAGNMTAYRESGVVESKEWLVGDGCCELCQEMEGIGPIPLDENFPNDGGDGPPLHPMCRCTVIPVVSEEQ